MLLARWSGDVLEVWVKGEEVCQKASGLKCDPYWDRVGDLLLQGIKPAFAEAQKEIRYRQNNWQRPFPL